MKKMVKFKYFIFIFAAFIIFNSNVCATTTKMKYKNGSNYIVVDKNEVLVLDNTVQYNIKDFKIHRSSWNEIGSWQTDIVYLYTDIDDQVFNDQEKWWTSLYVCKSIDWVISGLGGSFPEVGVYTSSLLSKFAPDHDSFLSVLGGQTSSKCKTYSIAGNVEKDNLVSYCGLYEERVRKIKNLAEHYTSTNNVSYKNEYKKTLNELKTACNQAMTSASWNDACVVRCSSIYQETIEWNKIFNPTNSTNNCGFSDKLLAWILNIIKWVKYILPVLVIILGIIDFIKAIGADKDDEMKKAQGRFVKRLIAAALVFLVPLIVEFVLKKFGFNSTCGLF